MKTLLNSITIFLFIFLVQFAYAQEYSEEELIELSALFEQDALYMDSIMATIPPPTFSQIPYSSSTVLNMRSNSAVTSDMKKILIISNLNIYQELEIKINRYATDISNTHRCNVIIKTVNGGTPIDIKNTIIEEADSLNGVIFIGDIPTAYYELENDHNSSLKRYWQCDLFYMDLDGIWTDLDNNNIFDTHTGNVVPEIFVARISTAYMQNNFSEKDGLENYLDKLHNFYIGNIPISNKYAMSYTDTDWSQNNNICNGISNLYGYNYYNNFNALNNPNHGRADFLNKLGDSTYEFVQLAAHSYNNYNNIYQDVASNFVYPNDILNTTPKAIAFNLFCCSACMWPTEYNNNNSLFIGTSYIYNNSPKALTVVGSTKSGGMLENTYTFYNQLNLKKVIGESLKNWLLSFGNVHDKHIVEWYYGMCILGDPMISMYQNEYMRLDLHVRDSESDKGFEPNNDTQFFWESNDIWVRRNNDSITTHQNPEYDPVSPNYLKVRIKNIGTFPSKPKTKLNIYWNKVNTSYNWPIAWSNNNIVTNPAGQSVICGGLIDSVNIPIIEPGGEAVVTIPWQLPNPADYSFISPNQFGFALLARIITPYDTMTFPETEYTLDNIKNNNNIACKGVNIVDIINNNNPTDPGSSTIIRNSSNRIKSFDLLFVSDTCDLDEEIYRNAEVKISLDSTIHNSWIAGGEQSLYLLPGKINNEKIIANNNAILSNITLNPYQYGVLNISFNFLTKKLSNKLTYKYHLIQKDHLTDEIVGGQSFIIINNERSPFYAMIDINEDLENQQIKLTAYDINEPSVYNWYNSQGNLIYSGEEINVPNNVGSSYKLEVISLIDGYKDYQNISISDNISNIISISPNPAQDNINIKYQLYNSNSAYIAIVDLSGVNSIANNYIIDLNSISLNINISNYPIGTYLVYLVCNGQIKDIKQIIKQ